ncbi:hypothetical protein HPP92_003277 [Vanilla planifolia]|uniref:Flowering locus T n=1 Tax=Vanilla planifolia TaxID=51239 RepID=A0A835SA26_VANPL|nr:hypothetical protein HPP92_003277 [Vanilla planifolia]
MDGSCLSTVIRDVVDLNMPSMTLRLMFDGNRFICNGTDLRPSAIVDQPRVNVGGDDMRVFYTLVMVDPDAPTPTNPSLREYLHWMVTDIPGTTDARFGRELVCYESPKPTHGIHRIVTMLFQQLGRATVFAPDVRQNFNIRAFAQQYNLGNAVAATYFNCQRQAGSGHRRMQ